MDIALDLEAEAEEERQRVEALKKEEAERRAEALRQKKKELRAKKLAEKKEFEDALRARVGDKLFKWWQGLPPMRQRRQIEDWDREEQERKRAEAEAARKAWEAAELKRRTHKYPDGSVYIGDYLADADGATRVPHGTGKLWWPDETIWYEGEWKDGHKHGHGIYYWKNGTKWEGRFQHDEMQGLGTWYNKEGKRRQCLYQKGRRTCWLDDLELGTRLEVATTASQFVKCTIIRKLKGTKRVVKYDKKAHVVECVDLGYRAFRYSNPRQAANYLTWDVEAPTAHDHRMPEDSRLEKLQKEYALGLGAPQTAGFAMEAITGAGAAGGGAAGAGAGDGATAIVAKARK